MTRWARLARLVACGAVGVLLTSPNVRAEYRQRVVVLERDGGDDADREITTRVRAELAAAGFEVVVLPVTEQDPKQAVESSGHELLPASVLLVERLLPSSGASGEGGGAELWLDDRLLKKTVVLRLKARPDAARPRGEAGSSQQAARVAVQAVELVKARLAELSLTRDRQPRSAPPARPPARPPREHDGARPNLSLGVGVLEGFQKGQHTLTPVLRLGVALPQQLTGKVLSVDVRGGFAGLGRTARIEQGAGAATLRHTVVTLDAVVRFLPQQRVQPFVSLGAGMLALDVAGVAPEPYRNASARTLTGLVTASGGLWLQPVTGVGIVLEGQLMDAWSKTIVRISGADAAQVAAPLLLLSGGLMAEF